MADPPSKRTFEIIPGVGVPPVRFGMTQEEVRRALGDPDHELPGISWSYHECLLQVGFEQVDGRVYHLDFSWRGPECDVRYRGVSVFYTPADELVRIISGEAPVGEPYEFTSEELDLGLWRPVVPSLSGPDNPSPEYRDGQYWQSIGISKGGPGL